MITKLFAGSRLASLVALSLGLSLAVAMPAKAETTFKVTATVAQEGAGTVTVQTATVSSGGSSQIDAVAEAGNKLGSWVCTGTFTVLGDRNDALKRATLYPNAITTDINCTAVFVTTSSMTLCSIDANVDGGLRFPTGLTWADPAIKVANTRTEDFKTRFYGQGGGNDYYVEGGFQGASLQHDGKFTANSMFDINTPKWTAENAGKTYDIKIFPVVRLSGKDVKAGTTPICKASFEYAAGAAARSSEKAITAFSFRSPSAAGVIDAAAKTIAVTVPAGTSLSALVATFTASTGATVKVGSATQVSGTTANNFTSEVSYIVTAEDGTTATWKVRVTAASGSGTGGTGGTGTGPTVTTSTDSDGTVKISFTDTGGGTATARVDGTNKSGVSAAIQDGKLVVTTPSFSGKVTVEVSVTGSNGAVTKKSVELTVAPKPVSAVKTRPAAAQASAGQNALLKPSTVISWAPSPNATSYRVAVDGDVAGTTTKTQFTVKRALTSGTKVKVTPLGGDSTVGSATSFTSSGGAYIVGNSGFATDSSVLNPIAKRFLDQVAAEIKAKGVKSASIEGHTDNVGTDARNLALSKARAEAVKDYLQEKVGSGVSFTAAASGSSKPVASNATETGRAANRRVEVRLQY